MIGWKPSCMFKKISPIQKHILNKLKNASTLRYRELHPQNTPNDLFNYHLQFLVDKGYVARSDSGYALSHSGIRLVADPLPPEHELVDLFKVNVITIVSRINRGKIEVLNQIRTSNPSYGKIGVMGGSMKKGESIEQAASRKLKEETGLEANFRILGCERRMLYSTGALFSDILFPITYADSYSGELKDTTFGNNVWVPIDQAIQNESSKSDSIKSISVVLERVKNGSIETMPTFFRETSQGKSI